MGTKLLPFPRSKLYHRQTKNASNRAFRSERIESNLLTLRFQTINLFDSLIYRFYPWIVDLGEKKWDPEFHRKKIRFISDCIKLDQSGWNWFEFYVHRFLINLFRNKTIKTNQNIVKWKREQKRELRHFKNWIESEKKSEKFFFQRSLHSPPPSIRIEIWFEGEKLESNQARSELRSFET